MDNETLFYLAGGILAASAVIISFVGLRVKSFPGKAAPFVAAWFVVFVGATTTFAVLMAQDHKAEHAAETHEAGVEAEEIDSETPTHPE